MDATYPTANGNRYSEPLINLPDADSPQLSFTNLVEAHVLRAIRQDHKLRLDKVRIALDYVEQKFGLPHPLARIRFQTDGVDLFVESIDRLINTSPLRDAGANVEIYDNHFRSTCFNCKLAQYEERSTAEVYGRETYQVQLWLEHDELISRCTCPLCVEGLFCKHCVAVGLAWIAEPPPYRPAGEAPAKTGTTMEDVRAYLARQEQDTLVGITVRFSRDGLWPSLGHYVLPEVVAGLLVLSR